MQGALQIVLAALVGSLPSLIALVRMRRIGAAESNELRARANSQRADAVDKLSETVVRLTDRLQELESASASQNDAIADLRAQLDLANRLIKLLLRGVSTLTSQLTNLGVTPIFVLLPAFTEDEDLETLLARWSAAMED